jgi:WD40 repeat protein
LLKTVERVGAGPHLAISPDGRLLASGEAAQVELRSLPDGGLLKTLKSSRWVYSVAISPDGRLLATGSEEGAIKLWSLPDGGSVPPCLMDVDVSTADAKAIQYTRGGASYTQGCGSPVPAGAVCTCNCVPGKLCSCVTYSGGGGGGSHYWHPN